MTARTPPPQRALGGMPSLKGEHDPIAVFRSDGIVEGWISKLEGRLSDGLSQAATMHIRTMATDGTRARLELDLDEVIAVAAAPLPPSPYRIARRQHAIEIEAGPYRVSGTAHLPLGADPERYIANASRQWLPLTDCTVVAGDDEWAVQVAIVNLDHASRKLQTYAAPPFG